MRKKFTNISKLLSQIGAESGPYDLITLAAVSKLQKETSLKTKEVIVSINESSYVASSVQLYYG